MATIRNEAGIHCRPSAAIVKDLSRFQSVIRVVSPAGVADGQSMMSLLSLGLEKGTVVKVRVKGRDKAAAAARAVELLETEFDFPPRDKP